MSKRLFIGGIGLVLASGLVLLSLHRSPAPARPPPTPPATDTPGPEPRPARENVGLVGLVVAGGSVDVAAKSDGLLEYVAVRVGDRVRKGDVLARLDVRSLQHELSIAQADLQAMKAQEEVARLALVEAQETLGRGGDERLLSMGAMSAEEQARLRFAEKTAGAKLVVTQAQVQSAQARVEQLKLKISEGTVRASFDATVSMRYLDPGTLVSVGRPIVHLLADGAQQVRFAIPESLAPWVETGTPVRLEVRDNPARLEGRVERVSPEVDTAARMVLAIASVAPHPGPQLPLGTVVRVWLTPGGQVSSSQRP